MSTEMKKGKNTWTVPVSKMAQNTFNPIRSIVDGMKITPHPEKAMIALSIGDPTVFGNLPLPETCEQAMIDSVRKRTCNGYAPSIGYTESRQAVANYVSTPTSSVSAEDVVLASGCSGALDLCISCLADPGQNILIPRPGFSLYKTLAESLGVEIRQYDLVPSRSWEIDLEHLASQVDEKTAAVLVCNPSNPCGSVYSKEHLCDIISTVEEFRVPIIADEIYDHFVFPGHSYHPIASLSQNVPVLACGGLTKRYLVPGWRMGWVVVNDRNCALSQVRVGLTKLSQRILGPNTIVQAALLEILTKTPESFFANTLCYIQRNANNFFDALSNIRGLKPVMPQGAMYMMVGIEMEHFPEFKSDVDFTECLVTEQSVFCLPATVFQYPNYFRIVLTVPTEKVLEACDRIKQFCKSHYQPAVAGSSESNAANGTHASNGRNGTCTVNGIETRGN